MVSGALLPDGAGLALFAGAVFVLNATPGADLLLTLQRSLACGPRAGLAAALGIHAGCAVHALAAACGLAGLLALYPQAYRLMLWAGAAYLAWLGAGLLRQAWRPVAVAGQPAGALPASASAPPPASLWADFRTGALTNLLNPKVAFFFLAFLPPFVPGGSPSRAASLLLLGGWFVVQSTLFLSVVVALASRLRRWQTPGPARRVAGALGGALFIALALRLLGARPVAA
jgi:threonine/homoserine/homoserine lactone efflux protein